MKFEMPNSGDSRSSWFGRWSTSGWMTPSLIATVCLILALGSYEPSQGNLHRLQRKYNQRHRHTVVRSHLWRWLSL